MNIGIIAPSPVPFCIGGAEKLWWGLQEAFNEFTPHSVELIKIPSPEHDFSSLVQSYQVFSQVNLDHFDVIISGKYPAWMVRHSKHVCYLLHRLRGLYDTDNGYQNRLKLKQFSQLRKIVSILESPPNWNQVDALFDELKLFLEREPRDSHLLSYPGQLIRKVIHFCDQAALDPQEIYSYAAISKNVAQRINYFPAGVTPKILYPPSNLKGLHCRGQQYFFTVSRLDNAKRVSLLIAAMKQSKTSLPLLIAGTGPEAEVLKEQADSDPRIEFLGFVKDQDLVDLYANALAVLYVPYDEDYGLVPIEAFCSGKPVITVTDAGGPLEFVRNHETGWVVAPKPVAIAQAIDDCCQNLERAAEYGKAGQAIAETITWQKTVDELLALVEHTPSQFVSPRRPRLLVSSTFTVTPPRNGGQSRYFNLYKSLSRDFEIDLISLGPAGGESKKLQINDSFQETIVPKSSRHQKLETRLERQTKIPTGDLAAALYSSQTPQFLEMLDKSRSQADIVIASHPYLLPWLLPKLNSSRFVYEAFNCEYDLKQGMFPSNNVGISLLHKVQKLESDACQNSDLIVTCLEADWQRLCQLYDCQNVSNIVVPNGVNCQEVVFVNSELRSQWKQRIGYSSFIFLFMGSWHSPNVEAARAIVGWSASFPKQEFLIVGSVGHALQQEFKKLPANVHCLGEVDSRTKQVALSVADVALNPMSSGSGSNLKVVEYLASGLPLITTEFGVRALPAALQEQCLLGDLTEFPNLMQQALNNPHLHDLEVRQSARQIVEEQLDWPAIARDYAIALKSLLK
ncbi:glycosyltransferase family 4 protein [Synechococcus elongatus]|uniref:Glycosyltransferase family 4 protein n=1 Tax=Synechococcus elongatus PCC 11802 TaxID=2283154 RepID=A0AAT9JVS4_SYNEL|nr:glycosyltransferase family 4 protein [Synechococcus elongatus]QFZ92884.1 glycosyltransferase [Synechococcus elongatus PCC 11802]